MSRKRFFWPALVALTAFFTVSATAVALASSVAESIVDTTAPTGSVTVTAGGSGAITINLVVTGAQVGTATFDVNRDWALSGGTFTGSNPQTFTVPPRAAQDPATNFSTSGTVNVDSGQAAGTFTLSAGAFNITNSNTTGAKLSAGTSSSYAVTVEVAPPPSDTDAPTLNCTVPSQLVWYGAEVTVNCTASDSGSGLANPADASFSLTTSVGSGNDDSAAATDSRTVYDKAGNFATAGPYTFKVDLKAPQLSSCDSPDGVWHASDVTLKCTYTDGGSGPASQDVSLTTDVASGTETDNALASAAGAQACDAVGNCAASPDDIAGNMIDKKAPDVAVTGVANGGTYEKGSVPTAGCSTIDGGSGVAVDASVSTSGGTVNGVGTFTATCSGGEDNVGNAAGSVSATYTVNYGGLSGILQPINPDNTSIFKRGQAVPVKFKLAGDEYFGFNTSDWTIQAKSVACAAFDGSDPFTESVPSNTPSTVFRYDASADQYIYNADMHNKAVGSCWVFKVTLDSGQPLYSAVFKLAK